MQKVFTNAIFITFVAIGVSWALIWVFAQMTYGYIPVDTLIRSALISVLIAFPTGLLLEAQKQQLIDTGDKLHESQKLLQLTLKELKRNSSIDCLTSVLRRGVFLKEIQRLHAARNEGAFLMIDADNFKTINDTYGHAAGDEALAAIAAAITGQVGADDMVGRLGGEEFGVFLNSTDHKTSCIVAENICRAVATCDFRPTNQHRQFLSVSIGGAYLSSSSTIRAVLVEADNSMYEAKRAGKNRSNVKGPPNHNTRNVQPDKRNVA